MSVNLVSLDIYNEYIGRAGGDGLPYLKGNVGDKMHARLIFEIAWSTENKSLVFSAGNRSVTRSDSGGSFIDDGFNIGDTFVIIGAASNSGTKTITGMTSTVLYINETLTDETVTCSIHGTRAITALDYYYNTIENSSSEDYTSLVDSNTQQKLNVSGLVTSTTGTTTSMNFATKSKGWQNGVATIKTIHFNGYKQRLQIDHWFHILPVFTTDLITNVQNGGTPNPEYFKGTKCLKYIAKIDAKFDNSNATIPHTSTFSTNDNLGNTGWFNENYNLGIDPFYTFESIKYTNPTGGTESVAIIDQTTDVEVIINASDTSDARAFTTGNTFLVNHIYCTLDNSDYIDTENTHNEAFRWDRAKVNGNLASNPNGDNIGTEFQSIKDVTATILSAAKAKINFTIDLPFTYKNFLKGRDLTNRNYTIFIGVGSSVTGTTSNYYSNTILCE